MANLNNNETESLNQFLEKFNRAVIKVFSHNLDKDVFKKFEFNLSSLVPIASINQLKQNNVIYELDYVRGEYAGTIAVLIPEELIAQITDVIMGGSGENAYKDSLSELEVNAFMELLPKVFKEVEGIYRKSYEQNLGFDAEPLLLTKSNEEEYENKFSGMIYDLSADFSLKINSKTEYKISLLLKIADIKSLLSYIDFISESGSLKGSSIDAVTLKHLSDIKINITAELGRAKVPIKYALELTQGSMVELDSQNDEEISVFANGIEVAKAQIVVIDDSFGLRITKIVLPEERIKYI